MRRVVSLWLPFWPTDRLRRHDATLPADGPLVTRTHDGHRRVIAAACPVARSHGLRAGMPLAHAHALVPELLVVDATPSEDGAALRELAAWCLRFSPLTAVDPPDGVWIDVTGCAHLHGGEEPMLHLLLVLLSRSGMQGRAAVADTPGAAHALARFGASPVTVAGIGATADALALLPVAALRIDGQTAVGLRRLGLDRVGQLAATARGPLARRFGPGLLLRLDQALGQVGQKGNRMAAPFGSPRGAVRRQSARQGHCPEGRRRGFAAPGAQRSAADSGPAPATRGRRPERIS